MQKGFIFSLDAFVAFTLTMITISLLIFTVGIPKPFYPSLEQAHQLAHDTLQVMATSSSDETDDTYLERYIGGHDPKILHKIAGGFEGPDQEDSSRPIIPKGYGYRMEFYNFNDDEWSIAYDAGTDGCDYGSDRCGKKFTKLQASATTFASIYTVTPKPGESAFCYLSCKGYHGPEQYEVPCNTTPCDMPYSNFIPGNNSIQLVRLVVYT